MNECVRPGQIPLDSSSSVNLGRHRLVLDRSCSLYPAILNPIEEGSTLGTCEILDIVKKWPISHVRWVASTDEGSGGSYLWFTIDTKSAVPSMEQYPVLRSFHGF